MQICTINVPDSYLDCIEVLINMGFYPSRSEAVRAALKQFLKRDGKFVEEIETSNFREMKESQLELQQKGGKNR